MEGRETLTICGTLLIGSGGGGGEGMWVRRWREGWEGWVELRGWLELRGWVCRGDVLGEEEVQALGVQWWVGKVGLGWDEFGWVGMG